MSYAIGGCLALGSDQASLGAKWLITDYAGETRRIGDVTENVCEFVQGFGVAYSSLFKIGAQGNKAPELKGPFAQKCSRCEFRHACKFRIEEDPNEQREAGEPVWVKYARPRNKNRDE
jgi:hypothetical protein